MLMGCAIAETTGLYALVIAILLIFVAPNLLVDILVEALKAL
jgi:F-type H+-transporting ATPase subunit c